VHSALNKKGKLKMSAATPGSGANVPTEKLERDPKVLVSTGPAGDIPPLDDVFADVLRDMFQARVNTNTPPNVRKFFYAMRRLGYSNYAAIPDIIDNSVDAGATLVKVLVQEVKSQHVITIADNGKGMAHHTLTEALRLGSDTERDENSDLGFFGMGLVTASISIATRLEVITKTKDGVLLYGVHDVEVMSELNEFKTLIEEAGDEQEAIFRHHLPDAPSGTVVRLLNCDQIQDKNTTQFSNTLTPVLARVYRMFISDPKRLAISVNGRTVDPQDPLMLDDPETSVEFDKNLDISHKMDDGTELTEKVRIRIVRLPAYSVEMTRTLKINPENQGFCLLRNNREIGHGSWLGLWEAKHPDLNRVRGEIFFPATLDDLFGVDFTKQSPKFKQSLTDQLKNHVTAEISRLKNLNAKERKIQKDADVSHTEAEKLIKQKANLLPKTPLEIEKRASYQRQERSEDVPKPPRDNANTGRTRTPKNTHVVHEPKLPCQFLTESMTPAGPIFDAQMEHGTLKIMWNRDHVFYEKFVLNNKDNKDMVVAVDFLVYALAKTELGYTDEEKTKTMLENIRSNVSSLIRSLFC
jgi:hypothetical protein